MLSARSPEVNPAVVPGNPLLEIAHLVRQSLDEVIFMVAGEGPDEVRLRKATKALGLEDVVTFATPQAGVEHVYRASDVMVLVSDWGGIGIHLLEGMALERPVVATGSGEVLSILGESGICELVHSGDRPALAKAVTDLIRDPDRRRALGARARRYVLEHFPLATAVERVADYYREVCERVIV
jgi:glycosyltransferase involved in cell wall biosynthesis